MKLYSPAIVKQIIDKHAFRFRKNLGQNFLIDGNIVNKIVEGAGISQEDAVLEIGAGIGTLTRALSEKAGQVVVIEIDKNLMPILSETLADCNNVLVHLGNALKINFDDLMAEKTGGQFGPGSKAYKVVANLPYYITTPLIMHALESHFNVCTMVFMIQKEVATRIVAKPGNKDYGALTLAINYFSEPCMVTRVPRQVFMPQPEVDSTVIRLNVRQAPPAFVKNESVFFQVVKAAFGQRRKTLANTLSCLIGSVEKDRIIQVLTELGIDPARRGETLSFEEFARLANAVSEIH